MLHCSGSVICNDLGNRILTQNIWRVLLQPPETITMESSTCMFQLILNIKKWNFTRWLVGAMSQCLQSLLLQKAEMNLITTVKVWVSPPNGSHRPAKYYLQVPGATFPNFWGKKAKATTWVTLWGHRSFCSRNVMILVILNSSSITGFYGLITRRSPE